MLLLSELEPELVEVEGLDPWASFALLLAGVLELELSLSLDLLLSELSVSLFFGSVETLPSAETREEVDDGLLLALLVSLEAGLPSDGSFSFGQLFLASPGALVNSSLVMFSTR